MQGAVAGADHRSASRYNLILIKTRLHRKQGQYLAFIHYYTKVNGKPPAEADMQRYVPRDAAFSAPDGGHVGAKRFIERIPAKGDQSVF